MSPVHEWEWFGDAAHFICGRWCRFHLATRVGPWLVSTVGSYVHPRNSGGGERAESEWLAKNWPGEEIGAGRKYETMVFKAGKPCDARGCDCGMPSLADAMELDVIGSNTPGEARRAHMELCHKWAHKTLAELEAE